MKLVGGFLIFLALYGFQEAVTFSNVLWFALGIFLIATEECIQVFMHTSSNVKK